MKWSPALPMRTALEGGEGVEVDAGGGGLVEQNALERDRPKGVQNLS